jgi:4-aminobutyrate aminotransferase/(S)-3-amino-2-methylpropionate transaminase
VIEEEGLCDRATAIGEAMRARMESWQQRWPPIGDVRGLGAMLAIELVVDAGTKEPAAELATKIVEEAARNGLLLLKSGIYSNCIRVLMPLVLADAELDEALGVWEQALESALGA